MELSETTYLGLDLELDVGEGEINGQSDRRHATLEVPRSLCEETVPRASEMAQ